MEHVVRAEMCLHDFETLFSRNSVDVPEFDLNCMHQTGLQDFKEQETAVKY